MTVDFGKDLIRETKLLVGLIVLLATSACSDVIEIVPIAASVSDPTEVAQATESNASVSGTGIPTRIIAEAIDLDTPVVEMGWRLTEQWGQIVSEWDVPDNDAAWHRNSARPGQGSNVVISGHNGSLGGQVFIDLEELVVGDQITIFNGQGESFVYQVRQKELVRTLAASQEALGFLQAIMQPTPEERLTLITCWPRWTNTHRLILIAEPQSRG